MVLIIRISDISRYLRCPRLIYFETSPPVPEWISPSHLLLRHLLLSWQAGSDLEGIEDTMVQLVQDLPLIYPKLDLADLKIAATEVRDLLPGLALLPAESLVPSYLEVELRSERLGLTGRLDRLVMRQQQAALPRSGYLSGLLSQAGPLWSRDPQTVAESRTNDSTGTDPGLQGDQPLLVPSLIRTGKAPTSGVWERDRLSLAGYSLLLEEKYGRPVLQGQVEYARSGQIRPVAIRSLDKGRFLRLRDRIRQIHQGQLPDRPANAPCIGCRCRDACHSRASLASLFF